MNQMLEGTRTPVNTRKGQLPELNRMPIPTFLNEAKGFECVSKFRELNRAASEAVATYRQAEANIDRAATADAEAEAEALIAGEPKPRRTATAKAITAADSAFADAHAAILASNRIRPQVFAAIQGEPGVNLASESATHTEANRLAALNHLNQAAQAIAEMQQTAAIPAWIDAVNARSNIDLAVGPMPSPRMGAPIATANGASPAHQLEELMVALESLARGEEREAA